MRRCLRFLNNPVRSSVFIGTLAFVFGTACSLLASGVRVNMQKSSKISVDLAEYTAEANNEIRVSYAVDNASTKDCVSLVSPLRTAAKAGAQHFAEYVVPLTSGADSGEVAMPLKWHILSSGSYSVYYYRGCDVHVTLAGQYVKGELIAASSPFTLVN